MSRRRRTAKKRVLASQGSSFDDLRDGLGELDAAAGGRAPQEKLQRADKQQYQRESNGDGPEGCVERSEYRDKSAENRRSSDAISPYV